MTENEKPEEQLLVKLTPEEIQDKINDWINTHASMRYSTAAARRRMGNILIALKPSFSGEKKWGKKLIELCDLAEISRATADNYVNEAQWYNRLSSRKYHMRKLKEAEVDLDVRENLKRANAVLDENPKINEADFIALVLEQIPAQGQHAHSKINGAAINEAVPHSRGGTRQLTPEEFAEANEDTDYDPFADPKITDSAVKAEPAGPRPDKPTPRVTVKDTLLAAYCVQLVDILLGHDGGWAKRISKNGVRR